MIPRRGGRPLQNCIHGRPGGWLCPHCSAPMHLVPNEGVPQGGALLLGSGGMWSALLPDGRVVSGRGLIPQGLPER